MFAWNASSSSRFQRAIMTPTLRRISAYTGHRNGGHYCRAKRIRIELPSSELNRPLGTLAYSPPWQGGVAARIKNFQKCAQTGRLETTRSILSDARVAHRFWFSSQERSASRPSIRWLRNITNRPDCAFYWKRSIFLTAQPPRLAKAGNTLALVPKGCLKILMPLAR